MRSEFSSLDTLNVETHGACVSLNSCSYNDFKACTAFEYYWIQSFSALVPRVPNCELFHIRQIAPHQDTWQLLSGTKLVTLYPDASAFSWNLWLLRCPSRSWKVVKKNGQGNTGDQRIQGNWLFCIFIFLRALTDWNCGFVVFGKHAYFVLTEIFGFAKCVSVR